MRRGGFGRGRGDAGEKSTEPSRPLTFTEMISLIWPFIWPSSASPHVVGNRWRVVCTWVMIGASKTCALSAPLYMQAAVNALVNLQSAPAIHYIFLYCLLRFLMNVFKELQSIVYIKVSQQASSDLLHHAFTHIHSLSFGWHVSKKTGNVVRIMDRGTGAVNTFIDQVFLFLFPALFECLAVIILFFAHFQLFAIGSVLILSTFFFSIATIQITLYRSTFREQSNSLDNDYHSKATDSILNYETVKYFTNEVYEINSFYTSVLQYLQLSSSTKMYGSILSVTQQCILNATLLFTAVVAGRSVLSGGMSVGHLGWVYGTVLQSLVDMGNLLELLEESSPVEDLPSATAFTPGASGGVSVDFQRVSFSYSAQKTGISNVSFSLKAGTTTAVVGHTGAGKTTLSRLLFRFYDPDSGAILLNGQNIRQLTQNSIRQAVGIVPQDTVLFNSSILQNIKYGRLDASLAEIEDAAEAAQLLPFIESLPDKWDTVVGERGLRLSGGEKQRVAIARCMLKNPPVVVLDEATSALDSVTEAAIQSALLALGRHRTVFIIAHRLSTIMHADNILVLDAGQVVESGTHETLLEEGGKYSKLWKMQLNKSASAPTPSSYSY